MDGNKSQGEKTAGFAEKQGEQTDVAGDECAGNTSGHLWEQSGRSGRIVSPRIVLWLIIFAVLALVYYFQQ